MDSKELNRRLTRGKGQHPPEINSYDKMKESVRGGNDELRPMLRMINQAMFETEVNSGSFSRVGNLVIRLSIAAANYPGMQIDDDKMSGMAPIIDTYARFIELQEDF
jgi:hypothetical protein